MKGLLLKDWYLARTHCRAFLLILFVFAIVSAYSGKQRVRCFIPDYFILYFAGDAGFL